MKGELVASSSMWIAVGAAAVGALIYAAADSKLAEFGRLLLFCGMFFLLWILTGRVSP